MKYRICRVFCFKAILSFFHGKVAIYMCFKDFLNMRTILFFFHEEVAMYLCFKDFFIFLFI